MPIFLWSMVVNQLNGPVVARGRRNSRGTGFVSTVVSASSTVVMRGLPGSCASFQLQEEVGDLLGFALGHVDRVLERRHPDPTRIGLREARARVGLAARSVPDPSPQIV